MGITIREADTIGVGFEYEASRKIIELSQFVGNHAVPIYKELLVFLYKHLRNCPNHRDNFCNLINFIKDRADSQQLGTFRLALLEFVRDNRISFDITDEQYEDIKVIINTITSERQTPLLTPILPPGII